ncbi:DUF4898 domain-containing protein [Acidianus sulfidivorans JP7]|uniref:DUF4898 domain-containing protein n=1 Tax=Acidianus sulfidivorans TaxID=312539 RepID=UPI0014436502|nr:DUF4898 domain-containing protein [Acidianus sulfidivorans]AWR97833.2 DUF4898 domain-containing protein [Acidianus sulfidivorans JP7]
MSNKESSIIEALEIAGNYIACERKRVIPLSMISDYEKFFRFIISKNTRKIHLVIPMSMTADSSKIKNIIESIIPYAEVRVYVSDKIRENIILCSDFS